MSFLKKLFGNSHKTKPDQEKKDPENTRLGLLLENWGHHPSNENYQAVMDEILDGNSFLLLPSVNENGENDHWQTAEKDTTIQLASVFNLDGLKVLGAFSNEKALVEWAKTGTQYTALRTQDIIELCKENGIDRVVINTNQPTMYVMERNRENIKSTVIEEETKVLVGTPTRPLSRRIIEKLIANFKKVETIEEAYQYAQTMNHETSIVLGIKMSVVSDNSRAALHNALNNALSDEQLEMPLDIMILETEDWLHTVRNIEKALFYKR